MPDWEVFYRAVADFSQLTKASAQAEAEFKAMGEAAKREGDQEADAARKAALAHDEDARAIDRQRHALEQLAVAEAAASRASMGGRSTMDQHLSDLQKEAESTRLLNYQRQRGFTSPQQDYAYRQQEMAQRNLYNRVEQSGYATRDEYLRSLQQETTARRALNESWAQHAVDLRNATDAAASHADAATGATKSVGELADATTSYGQSIDLSAYDSARAKVDALKSAVKDLSAELRNANSGLSSTEFVARLGALSAALKDLGSDKTVSAKGLQVSGLGSLQQSVKDLAIEGGRAFDDLEVSGKKSSNAIVNSFREAGGTISTAWRSMVATAKDAVASMEQGGDEASTRIAGAFKGLASGLGSGGGIGGIFKSLLGGGGLGDIMNQFTAWGAIILGIIQLLPMLTAGIAALGASLAALPGFLIAATAGFAVFLTAIMPVIQAVSAFGKVLDAQDQAQANPLQTQMQLAQQNKAVSDAYYQVGQAAVQAANAQVTSAHSVRDAQFALAQAHFQATQTQIQDSHNLEEATYSLRQAQFSAAMQAMQSSMQQASAQHALADANFQVQQSQFSLNMAWQQASYSLAQLTIQVNFAQTNIRGAQLALEQAQQNYAQVMAQSTSTALQRAMAANEIRQAEEALAQTELDSHHNEQQLADVRKYGASQMFGVTQAQHALADAQFAQVQAQKQLIITEKEAANAQIQAAHAIMDAIYGVSQAQTQQRNDAVVSAHNISDAQFALQQAYFNQSQSFIQGAHNQQDAAFQLQQALLQRKLGLPEIASAQQQFNTALSELGPAGREAVSILDKLAKFFDDNHQAEEAFWKALDPALRQLPGLLKPINDFLTATASAMGGVLGNLMNWLSSFLSSPAWDKIIVPSTVKIIQDVGTGLCAIAEAFGAIAVAAAPFAQFVAGAITQFFVHFSNWLSSAAKSGEMARFLKDTESVLGAIAKLGGAVLKFFEGLMGNTAAQRTANMKEFVKLLNSLSTVILPDLLKVIQVLAQPKLADAMINLMNALANMLAQIVATPAFAQTVQLLLQALAGVMNIVAKIASIPAVGSVLGVIAGTFVTLSVLRFTHITDLLGLLFKLPGLKQGLQWLKDILPDWITGSAAGVEAGGKAAAATIEAAMVSGGDQAAAAIAAAMKGGVPGGAPGTGTPGEGDAAAAAAKTEGVGERLKRLFTEVLPAGILELAIPIEAVALLTGKSFGATVMQYVSQFNQLFVKPTGTFFLRLLPDWLGGANKGWGQWMTNANNWWKNDVGTPFDNFFSRNLPNYLGGAGKGWKGLYDNVNNWWANDVSDPFNHYFSQTLPNQLGGAGQGWKGLWDDAKNLFSNDIVGGFAKFFTQLIPGWWDDLSRFWSSMWSDGWTAFHKNIITPMATWFSQTLPNAIVGGFKSAVDVVIRDVINKVIHIINDVTSVVGIKKIPDVPQLAGGGSVPAAGEGSGGRLAAGGPVRLAGAGSIPGAGDGDQIHIMAEPGEWMLRKAARMAIDRTLGTDFLPKLNHADKWPGFIGGGGIPTGLANPIGHGLSPERVDMGVDYGGRGPLFALGAGTIVNLYNAGWPGGAFIAERLSPSYGSGYWYMAEDVVPVVRAGENVRPGQHIADAWGGPSGIEVGWAAPPGSGQTMAAAAGQNRAGLAHGDPGAFPTGWGVNASNLIGSLGGPPGIISGPVQGSPGGIFPWLGHLAKGLLHALGGASKQVLDFLAGGVVKPAFDLTWSKLAQPLIDKIMPTPLSGPSAIGRYGLQWIKNAIDRQLSGIDQRNAKLAAAGPGSSGPNVTLGRQMAGSFHPGWGSGPEWADLDALWTKESGWNNFAQNPTSGAFGIAQALPYSKMPRAAWPMTAGGRADAASQILWGLQYIRQMYGDPITAWQHELAHDWYATGGPISWTKEFGRLTDAWDLGRSEYAELLNRPTWKTSAERRMVASLKGIERPWDKAWRQLSNDPSNITGAEWTQLHSQTSSVIAALGRAGGHGRDYTSGAGLRHSHPTWWRRANTALRALRREENAAFNLWLGAPSQSEPGPIPNPLPPVSVAETRIPDIMSLISGGPGQAFYAGGGAITAPTMGLAISGPSGFALGGAIFPEPRYAGSVPDRQLSAAGAAGQGGVGAGPLFRDIIVHNPLAEPAAASITRNVTRLGFLAGRGPV